MSTLYEIPENKGIILYPHNHQIILRHKTDHHLGQPMVLDEDYGFGLTDVVYNSTLYYAYGNLQGDLIVKSIWEYIFPFQQKKDSSLEYLKPRLTVFADALILFFISRDAETNLYHLQALLPYQSKARVTLSLKPFTSLPEYDVTCFHHHLILSVEVSGQISLLEIQNEFQVNMLAPINDAYEAKLSKLKEELLQAQKQVSQKSSQLKQLQNTLQSATTQYNELMHVAEQYRQETIRLRKKENL